jgi:hypothetical protein
MDPAVNLPILPPIKERARVPFFPIGINPVVNPVNPGQILTGQICGSAIPAVRKTYEDMHEDVATATFYPWNQIFRNPILVPSPFLAALPALQAVLDHHVFFSREICVGYRLPVVILLADVSLKTAILQYIRVIPYPLSQPGPSVKPASRAGR